MAPTEDEILDEAYSITPKGLMTALLLAADINNPAIADAFYQGFINYLVEIKAAGVVLDEDDLHFFSFA